MGDNIRNFKDYIILQSIAFSIISIYEDLRSRKMTLEPIGFLTPFCNQGLEIKINNNKYQIQCIYVLEHFHLLISYNHKYLH